MDVQNVLVTIIIMVISSANPPISVAAPKPLSSNMDSISVLPTKTPSFESSNIYPPMSLQAPEPFGGGIKYNYVTLTLSGEVYLLKVGSSSFGSPVSASAVSKPIFEFKATENNKRFIH